MTQRVINFNIVCSYDYYAQAFQGVHNNFLSRSALLLNNLSLSLYLHSFIIISTQKQAQTSKLPRCHTPSHSYSIIYFFLSCRITINLHTTINPPLLLTTTTLPKQSSYIPNNPLFPHPSPPIQIQQWIYYHICSKFNN